MVQPSTMPDDLPALENRTRQLGNQLYQIARREHEHLSALNRWTQQVLQWCLSDPDLKSRVLRFIDVLPSLHSSRAVVRHVREYFPSGDSTLPTALRLGVAFSRPGLLTAPALALIIRRMVERVSEQFIAGTTDQEAATLLSNLASEDVRVSFDVLGEQVISEDEAKNYVDRYRKLISILGQAARDLPLAEIGSGQHAWVHLSLKPSALTSHFDPLFFEDSVERALDRLLPLARLAQEQGAMLNLDAEEYHFRDLTLGLARRLMVHPDLADLQLGIVIQAYFKDAETCTNRLLSWLGSEGRQLSVRLVKGAYWDYEVAHARQNHWRIPVFQQKWRTDQMFERLTAKLCAAHPMVRLAVGSHNLRSLARTMAEAETAGLSKSQLEFQLLFGMAEVIRGAVRELGYPVRIYAPVGELIPGMGYLVRRLLENSANESFLRQDLWEERSTEALLRSPNQVEQSQ